MADAVSCLWEVQSCGEESIFSEDVYIEREDDSSSGGLVTLHGAEIV